MISRTVACLAMCLSAVMPLFAANSGGQFRKILDEIERNSTTLAVYGKSAEAQKIGNRTGLAPENPEIELGYLPGIHGGARKDIGISQSFDFPTLYSRKGKLADALNVSADLQLRSRRMDLLLEAERCCIELVYDNALAALYSRQLDNAKAVADAYERKFRHGEATRIECNKAALNLTNMENELKRVNLERRQLLSRLTMLNGGVPVEMADTSYNPVRQLPSDFRAWVLEAEAANPAFAYLRQEIEVAKKGVGVSKAMGLPKFSVGYAGEFTPDEGWQGVKLGVSIPLWENRNRVKHARAEVAAAEQAMDDARLQYSARLEFLFEQSRELAGNISRYESVFEKNSNDGLLYRAFSGGELSLLDYLLELEYYFNSYEKLMQTQRDLRLTLAELYAYEL
ncbi:MAG: TolC family protein [Muribaculaceae bacterium]|nr:TolC family protein [Muribaculaceae bacterium]